MPSAVVLQPGRPAPTDRLNRWMPALIAITTGALVLAALWGPFDTPPTVDLEIVNGTGRDIHVSVRGPGDHGVVRIGTVGADQTYRFGEVVEHGDTWVVIFSSAGVDGGELSLTRAELDDLGWTVTVPAEVDRELARAGVPESP
jgi:hypothetical protein